MGADHPRLGLLTSNPEREREREREREEEIEENAARFVSRTIRTVWLLALERAYKTDKKRRVGMAVVVRRRGRRGWREKKKGGVGEERMREKDNLNNRHARYTNNQNKCNTLCCTPLTNMIDQNQCSKLVRMNTKHTKFSKITLCILPSPHSHSRHFF
jgi:hypothetical protein